MTIEQMYLAALSIVSGVVVMFWKMHQNEIRDLKKRVTDCEADRSNLWADRDKLWKEFKKHLSGPQTDP